MGLPVGTPLFLKAPGNSGPQRCAVRFNRDMSENQNAHTTNTADNFELPGVPDAFQRLWTPHRTAYVSGG